MEIVLPASPYMPSVTHDNVMYIIHGHEDFGMQHFVFPACHSESSYNMLLHECSLSIRGLPSAMIRPLAAGVARTVEMCATQCCKLCKLSVWSTYIHVHIPSSAIYANAHMLRLLKISRLYFRCFREIFLIHQNSAPVLINLATSVKFNPQQLALLTLKNSSPYDT